MMANNTSAIIKALASYRWYLEQLEEAILSQHWKQIHKELEEAAYTSGLTMLRAIRKIMLPLLLF